MSPPERRGGLPVSRRKVVVETVQAQVVRKVFGGQHQAETGAAGHVVLRGPLRGSVAATFLARR